LSKQLKTANSSTPWKQEVNRRLAAHMSRKPRSMAEPEPVAESHPVLDSRAAEAAARVAARYAHAPSFGEELRGETSRTPVATEAAVVAMQDVQVEPVPALHAAAAVEPQSAIAEMPSAAGATLPEAQDQTNQTEEARAGFAGAQPQTPAPAKAAAPRKGSRARRMAVLNIQETEAAGPAQPIPANLIRFPRPMVATRKKRPRRAEGPLAMPEAGTQLSIFEVEPETVSIEASLPVTGDPAAQAWSQPDWPGIELEPRSVEELLAEQPPIPRPVAIELAPLRRRVLAAVVDAALILTAFIAGALLAASRIAELPGPRSVELSAGLAVLLLAISYLAFFFTVGTATPGMRYAGIHLSTFSGAKPDRAQRCTRLVGLFLSLAPLGLGLAWALFDDAHLTWHDRLSHTYLRKR
jgi:uncharacterized RDD family membrane protein YckC